MAAKPAPKGDVTPDSKVTQKASPVSSTEKETPVVAVKEDSIEDHVEEQDLEALEQSVPYSRFKEVNEKAKVFKSKAETLESSYQEKLNDLTRTYEAKLAAKEREDDYSIVTEEDPGARQVKSLEKQIKTLTDQIGRLDSGQERYQREAQIKELKSQYPKADITAVRGWKVVYPEASLDELMEKSHNDNLSMVKASLSEIIEKKKVAAKKTVLTGHSPLRITEADRPKTLKDAASRARDFLNGI